MSTCEQLPVQHNHKNIIKSCLACINIELETTDVLTRQDITRMVTELLSAARTNPYLQQILRARYQIFCNATVSNIDKCIIKSIVSECYNLMKDVMDPSKLKPEDSAVHNITHALLNNIMLIIEAFPLHFYNLLYPITEARLAGKKNPKYKDVQINYFFDGRIFILRNDVLIEQLHDMSLLLAVWLDAKKAFSSLPMTDDEAIPAECIENQFRVSMKTVESNLEASVAKVSAPLFPVDCMEQTRRLWNEYSRLQLFEDGEGEIVDRTQLFHKTYLVLHTGCDNVSYLYTDRLLLSHQHTRQMSTEHLRSVILKSPRHRLYLLHEGELLRNVLAAYPDLVFKLPLKPEARDLFEKTCVAHVFTKDDQVNIEQLIAFAKCKLLMPISSLLNVPLSAYRKLYDCVKDCIKKRSTWPELSKEVK